MSTAHSPAASLEYTVLLFLGCVFVLHEAARFPVSTDVDPHARIAMKGQMRVGHFITGITAATLLIGKIFQDGWNRRAVSCIGQPDPGGQTRAVFQLNPLILQNTETVIG